MNYAKGEVFHERLTGSTGVGGEKVQLDRYEVSIPTSILSEAGRHLLYHGVIKEFDCAWIDWDKDQIMLYFNTNRYIPEECAQDDCKEIY